MDFLDRLQTGVLCGDGAMGTFLLQGGISLDTCLEELCLSAPERIRDIHAQYLSAGAKLIKTNTFGANAVRLARFGFADRVTEINDAAARIACEAAEKTGGFVAGSVGPLGITAEQAAARGIDHAACFREQITALLEGGVHLVCFETFTDFDEMSLALRTKNEIGDAPALCSFACAADGLLRSGMHVAEAFAKLRDDGAAIVGLNCINGPHEATALLDSMCQTPGLFATYPNAGLPTYPNDELRYAHTPEDFAEHARNIVVRGARLIGGCCGTTPAHVRAIADALAGVVSLSRT